MHRYITTRTDTNPNYCLMLGAGCSVSSGVKTGKELVESWRKEIFYEFKENSGVDYDVNTAIDFLSNRCGSWYSKSNEYSSLFEKKYDLPRQRRMFVEQQVNGVEPSLGYAYLSGLIDDSYFNTVFTTNFDDLLNESFYQFTNLRPIVCAHDSSISSVTVTSKRPKVIKLHGDYLFDDIKSTLRETESLEENIKNKFIEFSKDYGVIVVGYSGCDRSIMDVMNYLLKQEDYLKNGIYWCIRKGDEVSEELRKLLWKDKVYYVVIDGFDEFFAYHHSKIKGGKLPLDTGFISSKSQNIVKRMLENESLKNSGSEEIKKHLAELSNLSKMHSFQNLLKGTGKNDYIDMDEDEQSDDELLKIFEIKEKLNRKLYKEAIDLCIDYEKKAVGNSFKIKLYRLMVTAYKGQKKYDLLLETYDKLIELDVNNPANYLNKSKYENKYDDKYNLIKMAMGKDEYFFGNYYEMADLLSKKYFSKYDNENFEEIVKLYDIGIKRSPDSANRCWDGKFYFIIRSRVDHDMKLPILKKIISSLEEQDKYLYKVFKMRMSLYRFEDKKIDESFIHSITDARSKCTEKDEVDYDILMLEALSGNGDKLKIEDFIRKIDSTKKYSKNTSLMELKAKVLAEKLCDLDSAISELEKLLKINSDMDAVKTLIEYKIFKKDNKGASDLIVKYASDLTNEDILKLEIDILESLGDFVGAYTKFKKYTEKSLFPNDHKDVIAYYLIKINKYEDARKITKEYLEEINFCKYADVAIINYELSQILIDDKKHVNKKRLSEAYDVTESMSTKAAIQALLGDKEKAFSHIKTAIRSDYTCRFMFKKWPVFSSLHSDIRWEEIFEQ